LGILGPILDVVVEGPTTLYGECGPLILDLKCNKVFRMCRSIHTIQMLTTSI